MNTDTPISIPPTGFLDLSGGYKKSIDIFLIYSDTPDKKLNNWYSVLLMEGFSCFMKHVDDLNIPKVVKLMMGELAKEGKTFPMCFISGFGNTVSYPLYAHTLDDFIEKVLPSLESLAKSENLDEIAQRVEGNQIKRHEVSSVKAEIIDNTAPQDTIHSKNEIIYLRTNKHNDVRINVKAMKQPPMIPAWWASPEVMVDVVKTMDNISLHAILAECERTGRFENCTVVAEALIGRGILNDYSKYPTQLLKVVKYASREFSPEELDKLDKDVKKILEE